MMASDLELYKKKYSGQRNAKQNHSEISLHTFKMATIKKQKIANIGKDMKRMWKN